MIKKFKKIIYFVIIILIIVKCFEIVFLNDTMNTVSEEVKLNVAYKEFDYGDYSKIKLFHVEKRRS